MNLTTDRHQGIAVVRVGEPRLMYPLLSEFSNAVTALIGSGERRAYLVESLFLNTVKYENDKLESYMRKISK